jgi:hypothetical protein
LLAFSRAKYNEEAQEMKLTKGWRSHTWLFWTGLFLACLLAMVLLAGGLRTSQANTLPGGRQVG